MQHLIIANISISQDSQGRFCLNDLHKAAVANGANERTKAPSKFFQSPQTGDLIQELSDTQNSGITPVNVIKGNFSDGIKQGTYVVKELVYAYAMWISPAFHIKVIRAYDAMMKQPVLNPANLTRMQLIQIALEAEQELQEANAKIEVLEPKAEALDRIATATQGSMCLTDAAKTLQLPPRELTALLSAKKWIYKRIGSAHWVAYQDKIQAGYLEHKEKPVKLADGTDKMTCQVLVTAKGLAKLSAMLN